MTLVQNLRFCAQEKADVGEHMEQTYKINIKQVSIPAPVLYIAQVGIFLRIILPDPLLRPIQCTM